ncbi:MAG: iron ABC transporter permease, partial [Candidatus Aureabacteria bacterium]|nr:iron ABC transporter permease [Candidatus Auribacterota bacterium]
KMKRQTNIIFLLFIACLVSFFLSLYFGSISFSPRKILSLLFFKDKDVIPAEVFWKIRLPRVLLGLFIGGGLAVCGAVFQSLLRNPLAEPFTLGVSGGGAFGVSLALLAGAAAWGITVFSLSGCLFSIILVYSIAARKGFSGSALILGGIVLNFLFSSFVLLFMGLARSAQIRSAVIWLMGDVSSAPVSSLGGIALLISVIVFFLFLFSRELDLLALGSEKAHYLGLDAEKFKKMIFLLVSLVVGACVSVSGIVGFVGLMMPHFARKLVGPSHRKVIPVSFLSGASFFMLCDAFARNIVRPVQIPVGVITGALGGIFFLVLLIRSEKWEMMT